MIGRSPALIMAIALLACGNAPGGDADTGPPTEGEIIFNANCALCHGRKGNLGMSGSKDLTTSELKREEVIAMIGNGKGGMMPYKELLTKEEIGTVADHVLTLRITPMEAAPQ